MQDACVRARFGRVFVFFVLAVFLLTVQSARAGVSYAYDELGRVTQATYTDGSIVQYQYDANGNIVSINRLQSSTLSISSFTPTIGQANSIVTIVGSGFSSTPSDNAVTVGGAPAVVNSASATQLVITVPMAAQTGPIGVTVGASSTASSQQFVVRRPSITSFSPSLVNEGNAVTITGNNFALAPPNATVLVGAVAATVTSVTNTKIVFTVPVGANGIIRVNTSYGEATAASPLMVLPSSVPVSSIGSLVFGAPGSTSTTMISQPGKRGLLAFDGTAGQLISLQGSGFVSTPANVPVGFALYSPSGAAIVGGSVSPNSATAHFPALPVSGRYLLLIDAGSAIFQFNAVLELNRIFDGVTAATASVATTGVQSKRFVITGNAGQNLGIGLNNLAGAPFVQLNVIRPDGLALQNPFICQASNPGAGCNVVAVSLPQTGIYQITVIPTDAVTMSFDLSVSPPATGTITSGGSANLNLSKWGQWGLATFTVTAADQDAFVSLGALTTSPAGQQASVIIYDPSGNQLVNQPSGPVPRGYYLPNLAAGTYKVGVFPWFGATANATIQAEWGPRAALPADGTTTHVVSTMAGQNKYFTFTGTAGQGIGVGLNNLTLSSGSGSVALTVTRPDGVVLQSTADCFTYNPGAGCSILSVSLPQTGTYQVSVAPNAPITMSFDLSVSPPQTAAITSSGGSANLNLSPWGRWGLVSFSVASTSDAYVNLSALATSPGGQQASIIIYDPNGNQLVNQSGGGPRGYNLANLAAGTYKVALFPWYGVTTTATIQATWVPRATLPTDSTVTHGTAGAGQIAYFSFYGVAGQGVGVGLNNLVLSSGSSATATVLRPDGGVLQNSFTCSIFNPGAGCSLIEASLPQTGIYQISVFSNDPGAMSFDLAVSPPLTGTFTSGVPAAVNLTTWGRWSLMSFTLTAGQNALVELTALSTTGGQPASVVIYAPNGTQLVNQSGGAPRSYNLTNLAAGTYNVALFPWYGATTTATMKATWGP